MMMIELFKTNGLKIAIDANMKIANFLDVTLNLSNGKYYPYRKPNSELLYINRESNHPPNIIKQLPSMIERRLADLSASETEFLTAKADYEQALKNSGYKEPVRFKKSPPKKRNRSRNIIYFNPPFNSAVSTNIGKVFLSLIDKHFPPHSKYSKIFNRNTVKLSYSCMPNMQEIISSHNKQILQRSTDTTKPCNCRGPCPVGGECRREAVIYKATVKANDQVNHYIGCSETEFKTRWNNHKSSFRHEIYSDKTRLAQHVWQLKSANENFDVSWKIQRKSIPYVNGTRKCDLCLSEKLEIVMSDPRTSLNKRTEIANKCRHRAKFKLTNIK